MTTLSTLKSQHKKLRQKQHQTIIHSDDTATDAATDADTDTDTDTDTENQLIKKHSGLIIKVAHRFNPSDSHTLDEYMQNGRIGLLKAIRKYNKARGQFSTFAYVCIYHEILSYIIKERRYHTFYRQVENLVEDAYKDPNKIDDLMPDNISELEYKIVALKSCGYTYDDIVEHIPGISKYIAGKTYKHAIEKIHRANK